MFQNHLDLAAVLVNDRREQLRRAAGHARLRRDVRDLGRLRRRRR
jgi:hypothetical protein